MSVGAQEPAENWDDDFDFQADGDEQGTGSATPFSSLLRTATPSQTLTSTESPAHSDLFTPLSAFASSSNHAFTTKRKLSAPAEEEDWDAEINVAGSSILARPQSQSSTRQHDLDRRDEAKQKDLDIENWDDDFEDASSPRKSTTGRPSAAEGDSTVLGGEYETWDEEHQDIGGTSASSQTHLPVSQIPPVRKSPMVPTRVSSLQHRAALTKENDELGLFSRDTSDDDDDHTVTARQRRLRSTSRSGSPPPPLPQLSYVDQTSLPFPLPTRRLSSSSTAQSPVFSPATASAMSTPMPSPLPTYARSPSAMSGSSAGSSSNAHGQALYGGGSHVYQSTTRSSGFGYTSASVFSLPNTLHSHTSYGSTVPLNPTNNIRPSASSATPASNRLRKQHGGGSNTGFAQLPPSPLIHKERERRRLRKKSRPSVGNRRDVFVVDEDGAGREDILSDNEQITSHQGPDERTQEQDVGAEKAGVDMDDQFRPPPKLTYPEKGLFEQGQRLQASAMPKVPPPPQTPRASRIARSVSAGPEHGTAGNTPGHGHGGLLGRIGSVKRWAKARRRRDSTAPNDVEVSETDRIADGDVSASDFSEQHPRQQIGSFIQSNFAEQVQRTPRPRSSVSSFLNTSRGGSPSPSPGSPAKWPNFFRNDTSSPTATKGRRRMTMGPMSGAATPDRTRANTITRESLDHERGPGKSAVPRRSTSQSRSRGAQVYGSALSAARASNGSLALNGSRTSLSSVKEHDSPAPRTRRKSFGRLIMDRLPSAMKTPEKSAEYPTGNERPVGSVRRISLVNKRARSPALPSDRALGGDNSASATTGPQMSAATPTGKRTRSRSHRYDLDDAPPVPELSAPYYGILRSADSNASQQSLALHRQQSRASSSASHLPFAPPSESRKADTRTVSSQSDASTGLPIDTPNRPSLSSVISSSDFETRLRQSGDAPRVPVKTAAAISQGCTGNSVDGLGGALSGATPMSLLPPIELHPPSPPQTLGVSTSSAVKSGIPAANGASIAPKFSSLSASKSSQGSDIHSATTSTSSLFYTPTSSPNTKKKKAGLSASPHSPGKASSLGRTTGPIAGSESAAGMGYSGSGTIARATALRRNSLGDLKIPARISQAQVSIRRDLGLVKEFAGRIGELKGMKTTYLSLLDMLNANMAFTHSPETHNPRTASYLMDLFNGDLGTKPEPDGGLQDRLTSIKTRYDISWECAELLIELGGGPVTEVPETGMTSASTAQSDAKVSAASYHPTALTNTTQLHPQFSSVSYPSQSSSPSSIGIPQSLTSSALPNIGSNRSRERAVTLASSSSGSALGPTTGSPVHAHEQQQKPSGSIQAFPSPPSDVPASTGRRDLSQRQLLLLRDMLSIDADTSPVQLTSREAISSQLVGGNGEGLESATESIVAAINAEASSSSVNNRDTPEAQVGRRWGTSSTVELPSRGQQPEANSGHSRQSGKAIGHRRQWSRVGLGKPSQGNVQEAVEAGDDDDNQKRWKGMRAIRDMLRAMKRVRTEVPQPVPLPLPELSSSHPMVSPQLSPPLPSNRPGGSSSRFGGLGVRMGMHSTSSLSSAVSTTSLGNKEHLSGYSNPRVISTGAVASTNLMNDLDVPTLREFNNLGTAMPRQYQSKESKGGPRRPSLASLFRRGYQSSGKFETSPVNLQSGMAETNGNSTGLNPSPEHLSQDDRSASRGKVEEGQEVEDDWDCMDSASDIETRTAMGPRNATIRGRSDQRRKLLKGHALKSSNLPQPPIYSSPPTAPDAPGTINTDTQSGGIPIVPTLVKGPAFSPPSPMNMTTSSQSSLSLSSSHAHFGKLPAMDSRTSLAKLSADAGTVRPSYLIDKGESHQSDLRNLSRQEQRKNGGAPGEILPSHSAKTKPLSLSSPQSLVNSSLSQVRSPLSPLSVLPLTKTLDIGLSSSLSISDAAGSGIALAMTPENIGPLLENAKEVQERLSECIRELTELLHHFQR